MAGLLHCTLGPPRLTSGELSLTTNGQNVSLFQIIRTPLVSPDRSIRPLADWTSGVFRDMSCSIVTFKFFGKILIVISSLFTLYDCIPWYHTIMIGL
eukprot:4520777-Amphidinium_carterae.1